MRKNEKQYYKVHINPDEVMSEQEVHEYLYGNTKKSVFEKISVELSYGYFNYWLVLIIVFLTLIGGILIGSLDASRRFNLPLSEVLSLNPAKSELALGTVDYSSRDTKDDTSSSQSSILPKEFNLDGFNGTINVYYDQVHLGDVYEGSYNDNTSKDNQYINLKTNDSVDDNCKDSAPSSTTDELTYTPVEGGQLDDSTSDETNDTSDSQSVDKSSNISNSNSKSHISTVIVNIDKVSSNYTEPDKQSDNESQLTIGASNQDTEDNTDVSEQLLDTRPSELKDYEPNECVIGDSSGLINEDSSNLIDSGGSPLWYEGILYFLVSATFTIMICIYFKKKRI